MTARVLAAIERAALASPRTTWAATLAALLLSALALARVELVTDITEIVRTPAARAWKRSARVFGPRAPVCSSPFAFWNSITAFLVSGPKLPFAPALPSACAEGPNFFLMRNCWSFVTSSPLAPCDKAFLNRPNAGGVPKRSFTVEGTRTPFCSA